MLEDYMHMTTDEQFAVETFAPLEADPNGKKPGEAGAKLDAGKNRLGLVLCGFARALQEVGKVGTYGAQKYSDSGWVSVPDGEARYTDAMLRHLLAEAGGEEFDSESGLSHAAHCCWNALARLDLALRRGPVLELVMRQQKHEAAFYRRRVQALDRPPAGPRTAAAMSNTLESCGRLGPEHAALVDACAELELENEMLRKDLQSRRTNHPWAS